MEKKTPIHSTRESAAIKPAIPIDLEALAHYEIERWHEEFSWPVPYDEYLRVEQRVKAMLEQSSTGSKVAREAIILNCKLYLLYSNAVTALKIILQFDQQNLQLHAKNAPFIGGLLNGGTPSRRTLALPSELARHNAGLNWAQKRLRSAKSNFRENGRLGAATQAWLGLTPTHALRCSMNSLGRVYLAKNHRAAITFGTLGDWYNESTLTFRAAAPKDLHDLAKDLVTGLEKIAEAEGVSVPGVLHQYLLDTTLELFTETWLCTQSLKKKLVRKQVERLYVGSCGNIATRMLAHSAKELGVDVHGFLHGEPIVYQWDKYAWLEYPVVNSFHYYSRSAAVQAQSIVDEFPTLGGTSVRIAQADTPYFERPAEAPFRCGPIQSVMIVPNAFTPDDAIGQGISRPEMVQLHLERTIILKLQKLGLKVIYKQHPDGKMRNAEKLFPSGVEFNYSPFEQVLNSADALLFYHSRTTTIGPALLSNLPIIYLDSGHEPMTEKMSTLFLKRCRRVRFHYDDAMRSEIHDDDFREALRDVCERPNQEFVNEFMLTG